MANEIYNRMLAGYDLADTTKRRNAIFEVNQQIILAGMFNGGFFDKAAFYGGTCLRIFLQLIYKHITFLIIKYLLNTTRIFAQHLHNKNENCIGKFIIVHTQSHHQKH